MLPHPVYPLCDLVPQIVASEVAAEKQYERHGRAVGRLELMDLRRLFLAALIRVREVARRLGFDKNREPILSGAFWAESPRQPECLP